MALFQLPSDPDSEETLRGLKRAFQDQWKQQRPKMYQALKADGSLEELSLHSAQRMLELFHDLSGPMGDHQAWYEAWRETAYSL